MKVSVPMPISLPYSESRTSGKDERVNGRGNDRVSVAGNTVDGSPLRVFRPSTSSEGPLSVTLRLPGEVVGLLIHDGWLVSVSEPSPRGAGSTR